MIFYTLKGPSNKLEIHDEKVQTFKKTWWALLTREPHTRSFQMSRLQSFQIAKPKFLLWGRIDWSTLDGEKGSFHYSTDSDMVKKIERYMQKKIEKNLQKKIDMSKMRDEDELAAHSIEMAA